MLACCLAGTTFQAGHLTAHIPRPSALYHAAWSGMMLTCCTDLQNGTMGLVVRAARADQRIGELATGTAVEVIAGPMTET